MLNFHRNNLFIINSLYSPQSVHYMLCVSPHLLSHLQLHFLVHSPAEIRINTIVNILLADYNLHVDKPYNLKVYSLAPIFYLHSIV